MVDAAHRLVLVVVGGGATHVDVAVGIVVAVVMLL